MAPHSDARLSDVIGSIPYRMAFAGGWIDQPFVSRLNPDPSGSMVVVALEPVCHFMERSGMATSTRKVARQIWNNRLPQGDPAQLMRELYEAENRDNVAPSGSQDMAGVLYPGVNRLDYDFEHEGGYFPVHIESNNDPEIARWLEDVIYMLPVGQRPAGYNPLEEQHLDAEIIRQLGQSGRDCYDAIINRDMEALGASMNLSMVCWEAILPNTVRHATIQIDLPGILAYYQERYPGAMFSGSGGGYLYVVSDEPVPGGFQVKVRVAQGVTNAASNHHG